MSVIELFKLERFKARKVEGGGRETVEIVCISQPFVLSVKDVVVAFVQVENSSEECAMLTKYIETQGDKWGVKAIERNGDNWKAQLVFKADKTKSLYIAPVAKGDSVYVSFAVHESKKPSFREATDPPKWYFKLSVGTITDGGNEAGKKKIVWNTKDVTDCFFRNTEVQKKFVGWIVDYAFAFLMDDGTFVFVFFLYGGRCTSFFLIAYSKDPSSDFTAHMDGAAVDGDIIFPWGKNLVLYPRGYFYEDDEYSLRVSNDMGRTWGKFTGPLAENLRNVYGEKFAFAPITIEGRRVLLFAVTPDHFNYHTEDDSSSSDDSSQDDDTELYANFIQLFMADDEHMQKVGHFFCEIRRDSRGNFLYTNDELFLLYDGDEGGITFLLIRLKKHLKKIKLLLEEWYPADEEHATGPA